MNRIIDGIWILPINSRLRFDKLEYLHLSTKIRVTLISSSATLPRPFGLTLLGDYLYWTDWRNYAVYRANKNSADVSVFVTGIGISMGIHGYNLSEKITPGKEKAFMFIVLLLILPWSGIFSAKKIAAIITQTLANVKKVCMTTVY